MDIWYDIYCDESGTDGSNIFYMGALVCTPIRAGHLTKKICELRKKHNYYSEFKWNKLRDYNREIYKEFIDIFFGDKAPKLKLMQFTKNEYWRKWERNNNKRLAKCYYCFIGGITSHGYKYNIYADQLFNDYGSSFNTINHALNKKRKNDWGVRHNTFMKEVNSSSSDLIQLVDVLMGAYKAMGNTKVAKIEISNYVKEILDSPAFKVRFSMLTFIFKDNSKEERINDRLTMVESLKGILPQDVDLKSAREKRISKRGLIDL